MATSSSVCWAGPAVGVKARAAGRPWRPREFIPRLPRLPCLLGSPLITSPANKIHPRHLNMASSPQQSDYGTTPETESSGSPIIPPLGIHDLTFLDGVNEELLGFRPEIRCIHPANRWFKDPRQTAPRLRSRRTILRELFQELTSMSSYYHEILSRYRSWDDPALMAQEDRATRDCLFPQFTRLPAELRMHIWQYSVPRRMLDPREEWSRVTPNSRLSVPHVARVCRESRDAVFRMGTKVLVTLETDLAGHPDVNCLVDAPFGFMTAKDIVIHFQGMSMTEPAGDDDEDDVHNNDVPIYTVSTIARGMGCEAVAAYWPHPSDTLRWRNHYRSQRFDPVIEQWAFLRDSEEMKTLFVLARRPIVLVLPLDENGRDSTETVEGDGSPRDSLTNETATQIFVDLYDDQRLAEITSLETEPGSDTTPRFSMEQAHLQIGLCLNCERSRWEHYHKVWVESFWLTLAEHKLDDEEFNAVFPPGVPYNPAHSWVREQLRDAPQFKPAVIFNIFHNIRPGPSCSAEAGEGMGEYQRGTKGEAEG